MRKNTHTCKGCKNRNKEIKRLFQKIARLEQELYFLKTNRKMVLGFQGENLIAKLIRGKKYYKKNASFDLILPNGKKVEVKIAKPLIPSDATSDSRRWGWNRILGQTGKKYWNYLILVGEKAECYDYDDNRSPYIFFLLNRHNIKSVLTNIKAHPQGLIYLNANLNKVHSEQGKKLLKYRKKIKDIKKIFKHLVVEK